MKCVEVIRKKKMISNFLEKAYTEGVYADTPMNRKLGRVGMTYKQYSDKISGKESSKEEKLKLSDFKEQVINDDNQIKLVYKDKEGNFVGEIIIFKEKENKCLYLEHITVDGKYRNKGLARQILKKALGLCDKENKDYDKIELWVDNADNQFISDESKKKENNDNLVKFYKSEGFDFQTEKDKNELSPNMVRKTKKKIDKQEIKEKIKDKIESLKKNNDYINIQNDSNYLIRFQRNYQDNNNFSKVFIKKPDGKVKTFENSLEDSLLNSVSDYLQKEGVEIEDVQEKTEDVNIENNKSIINNKVEEAKKNNLGTITIKGNNGKIIYLSRKKESRWLKDFEAYTVRDSKRNVLSQGRADSEEKLFSKLNDYLKDNKINLQS